MNPRRVSTRRITERLRIKSTEPDCRRVFQTDKHARPNTQLSPSPQKTAPLPRLHACQDPSVRSSSAALEGLSCPKKVNTSLSFLPSHTVLVLSHCTGRVSYYSHTVHFPLEILSRKALVTALTPVRRRCLGMCHPRGSLTLRYWGHVGTNVI